MNKGLNEEVIRYQFQVSDTNRLFDTLTNFSLQSAPVNLWGPTWHKIFGAPRPPPHSTTSILLKLCPFPCELQDLEHSLEAMSTRSISRIMTSESGKWMTPCLWHLLYRVNYMEMALSVGILMAMGQEFVG